MIPLGCQPQLRRPFWDKEQQVVVCDNRPRCHCEQPVRVTSRGVLRVSGGRRRTAYPRTARVPHHSCPPKPRAPLAS
eukprot:7092449-Prymnesium_polylepis.1